jgi:hypothetical protein
VGAAQSIGVFAEQACGVLSMLTDFGREARRSFLDSGRDATEVDDEDVNR